MALKNPINFIDLFSGAGGISCGLEKVGYQCLLGLDYDKYAMETFALNHKHATAFCGDIRKVTKKKFFELTGSKKIDLVVGGPPCQGFSTVGAGNPDDERNHLFHHFLRIVNYCKPEFIVIENVTGLLAKKNEKTLYAILSALASKGYYLDFNVLSSEMYGVPEKRRRTIIIGSRQIKNISLPLPTRKTPVTIGQVIDKLKTKNGKIYNHNIETSLLRNTIDRNRLDKIPEGRGIRYERDELELLPPKLRLGIDWKNIPEGRFRQTKYYRLNSKLPSPTIMTHRGNYYHPTESRYLTAREAAKIQSFPNNFIFTGPLSAQWKQIGNAVPPVLAKEIGKHLLKLIEKNRITLNSKNETIIKKSLKKNEIKEKIIGRREKAFLYKQI